MSVGPVIETPLGRMRGVEYEGFVSFLGIPYAVAPTEPALARFGPPTSPEAWRGVRNMDRLGPVAPQAVSGPLSYLPGDPPEQDEECRTLNVWTPACDEGRRPVLVFIHGGAFLNGSGASNLYRGERLARRGVVVVTLNYRLGAAGFLAHPALAHRGLEGCGNFGLADQLAALRFVKRAIRSFGGDPQRVTLLGESAGAMAIADFLGMRAARGLFDRAIVESGAVLARPVHLASDLAERLGRLLGLAELTRERLVGVPIGELVAAQQELSRSIDEGVGVPFSPVVDGGLIDRHPANVIAAGAGAGAVPVLAGTNRDEFTLFSFLSPLARDLDPARLEELVARYLHSAGLPAPPSGQAVVEAFRSARESRAMATTARSLLDAFGTDWVFRVPLVRMLEAHGRQGAPTFAYRFDWASPFPGAPIGACHGLELPFVFGTLDDPVIGVFSGNDAAAWRLSEQMQDAWTSFAATGDPSCPSLGEWPRYEPKRRSTMLLGSACHVVDAPDDEEREYLDGCLGRYGVDGPAEGAQPRSLAFLAPATGVEVADRVDGPASGT